MDADPRARLLAEFLDGGAGLAEDGGGLGVGAEYAVGDGDGAGGGGRRRGRGRGRGRRGVGYAGRAVAVGAAVGVVVAVAGLGAGGVVVVVVEAPLGSGPLHCWSGLLPNFDCAGHKCSTKLAREAKEGRRDNGTTSGLDLDCFLLPDFNHLLIYFHPT